MPKSNFNTTGGKSLNYLLIRLFKIKFIFGLKKRQVLLGFILLFSGLLLTLYISQYVKNDIDHYAKSEFDFICVEIQNKISTRLSAHAQLLRSLSALFENPNDVTRSTWKSSYLHQKIEKNLPGILGVGYSEIISPDQLEQHEAKIREEGFPDYSVFPKGKREIYTSIIYIEPFSGRNLRAFGYDMFSEPVRRAAMEKARDFDIAALSGKIILLQETGTDIQAGTLMYVPVYRKRMQTETVEDRRKAIKGWVYTPYRMNDLMAGILGGYETIEGENLSLEIYDDSSNTQDVALYDSRKLTDMKTKTSVALTKRTSIDFNGKTWFLEFIQYNSSSNNFRYKSVWYAALGGISITTLFFVLYIYLLAKIKANELSKELNNKLHESEEKLNALFVAMTEMVVLHELVFNDNGEPINYKIIGNNDSFTEITGLKKEDVFGKLATEVYNTNTPPYLTEYSKVAISGKPHKFNTYYPAMDKHFLISVVSPKKGQFATVTTDITSIKQIEKVINDKNKELEKFLYASSHDLRTPLVNIQGFSQRLQKQIDSINTLVINSNLESQTKANIVTVTNESIPKTLNFIFTNVAKMDVLINGLLTISRTGRVKMDIKEINMNKLFENITNALNFQIMENSANIIIEELPNCYGDENLLNQLFTNIIENAFKYRNPNKDLVLKIYAQIDHKSVIYSIKDNGIGIAERYLEKIWDVFFRVDSTKSTSGDGIGLSLCQSITRKHNGEIWAESEEGKGSVFSVKLKMNDFTE